MNKWINFDSIWKLVTTLMLIATLYLNANYVTTQRFEMYQKDNDAEHARITEVLSQVNISVSLLQANAKLLEDMRLKQGSLVVDVADLKARVIILEGKPRTLNQ